jgi:uncharacterized protein YuzE
MKVIYDSETDTLTMLFRDEPVAESDELRQGIVVDYNQDGKIISVEILNASESIAEPQSIVYELKGKLRPAKV